MKVKKDICPEVYGKKHYNPNNYVKWDAGVAFLGFLVFFKIVIDVLRLIIRKTNFGVFLGKHYWVALLISLLVAQFSILIFSLVYGKIRKVGFLSGGGFGFKWNTLQMAMGIMLCMGLFFVFQSVHMQVADDFAILFGDPLGSSDRDLPVAFVWIYAFVLSTVLPAICEEALMRGIIYRALEGYGKTFAIVCSGVIFAIFHGNTSQLVLQFLGGMAFALALCATRNFFISCSMHFLYNFFVTFIQTYFEALKTTYYLSYVWFDAISVIFGFALIIISVTYFVKLCIANEKKTENNSIRSKRRVYLYDLSQNSVSELYAGKISLINERLYEKNNLFLHGNYFISPNVSKKKVLPIVFLAVSVSVGIVLIFI